MTSRGDSRSIFDISWAAIAKILITIVLVWIWLRLWQLAMILLISVFIAVAIDPVVRWLEERRIPRGLASAGCIVVLAGGLTALALEGWSSISQQSRIIAESLTAFYRHLVESFPLLARLLPGSDLRTVSVQQYASAIAASFVRAVVLIVIGMILTVYLSIEWKRTVEWLIAFVPKSHRLKVRQTLTEAEGVVSGYVAGNAATALFATTFVFVVLTLLKVPAAPLLALLAGVFDFLPVLGFVLSGVPAVVLAATVSTAAVVLVVCLYIAYHFIENYFIVPKVYGAKLRLSKLAVLISFAVGAELGGVIGAILALPIAAAYPAVEQIWLRDRLETDTVEKHQRLEHIKTPA